MYHNINCCYVIKTASAAVSILLMTRSLESVETGLSHLDPLSPKGNPINELKGLIVMQNDVHVIS